MAAPRLLDLSFNWLEGSIPPELANIDTLEELYLEVNLLGGRIPVELASLGRLTDMFLYDNRLEGTIPRELGGLSNLEDLRISENRLTGRIPPELGKLSNLEVMWMFENQLEGEIPPELGNLSSVLFLYLGFNRMSGPIPPELGNLRSIVELGLDGLGLTGPIPPELGNLRDMTGELNLRENNLSGEIPAELGQLVRLEKLRLGHNDLSGSLSAVGRMHGLQWLDLSHNPQLAGPLPASFVGLEKLSQFESEGTKLCVAPDSPLADPSIARRFRAPLCNASAERSTAYLIQSIQSARYPVPLIAGEGAGEYHHMGEPGASVLDWNGSMVSAHVGADTRVAADILAGVAASHSSGTFDFTDKTGASPVAGTYGTAMTSINPYVAWFPGERGSAAWGTAGFGWGDIEVEDEREDLRTSPARMMTGAAGGSYQLMESAIGGVRIKAEGWAGRVLVDGGPRIDSVTLDMQRARLALEWTQGYRSAGGNEVAMTIEGGMRYDNGDGINGAGAEVGGGVRYRNVRLGLTAEGRGRMLIAARDGYEEWGFGGMIQLDPATRGQGLQVRLAPSYGDAASGVNQLWERGVSGAVHDRALDMGANVDAEVAYRLAGFHGTPYGGFRLSQSGARAFSSGLRYDLGSGLGLRIEGTRRESALGGAEHTVGVRGRVQLR